jgi:hypothetical protein
MALQARRDRSDFMDWQIRLLVRAEFEPAMALALMSDSRIDLQLLLQLISRGCPPDLAARIVAPLEEGDEIR